MDEATIVFSIQCLSLVQDFVAGLLPCGLFWRLQVSWRKKLGVMAIFALGALTCATGCARIHYLFKVYYMADDLTCKLQ